MNNVANKKKWKNRETEKNSIESDNAFHLWKFKSTKSVDSYISENLPSE